MRIEDMYFTDICHGVLFMLFATQSEKTAGNVFCMEDYIPKVIMFETGSCCITQASLRFLSSRILLTSASQVTGTIYTFASLSLSSKEL